MEVQSALGSGVLHAVVEQHRSNEQAATNALDKNGNSSKKTQVPGDTQVTDRFDALGLMKPVENRGSVFDLLG